MAKKDTETPASIEVARQAGQKQTNLNLVTLPGAGHAFADRYVQGRFPNPKYQREAAQDS